VLALHLRPFRSESLNTRFASWQYPHTLLNGRNMHSLRSQFEHTIPLYAKILNFDYLSKFLQAGIASTSSASSGLLLHEAVQQIFSYAHFKQKEPSDFRFKFLAPSHPFTNSTVYYVQIPKCQTQTQKNSKLLQKASFKADKRHAWKNWCPWKIALVNKNEKEDGVCNIPTHRFGWANPTRGLQRTSNPANSTC